jgi:putative ABC transport system substrate-binding protein
MVLGQIKRRDFITLLGGAAVVWPLAARAQQRKTALIGVLSGRSPDESAQLMAAFHGGLGETGYFAGKNLTIEYRWAEGREDRLLGLAAELVNREVAAIAAVGGANSALAAKRATSTIPIVFSSGADPVKLGLVASLNRPGGNVTGVAQFGLIAKRLELMHELVPTGVSIAFLSNPHYPNADDRSREAQKAGRALGREVVVLNASNEREIDGAFAILAQRKRSALLVDNVALFNNRRQQIVALAARYAVPACYELPIP